MTEQKERPPRAPIQGYLGVNNSINAQKTLDKMQIEQDRMRDLNNES